MSSQLLLSGRSELHRRIVHGSSLCSPGMPEFLWPACLFGYVGLNCTAAMLAGHHVVIHNLTWPCALPHMHVMQ